MAFSPVYRKGRFLQVCGDRYLELKGDVWALCSLSGICVGDYYRWYATDAAFREEMDYFRQALDGRDELVLREMLNDDTVSPKYRIEAYDKLHPAQQGGDSADGETGCFSLDIHYNGNKI